MAERDIFIAALQMEDREQRRAYLEEACAGEPELRRQVERLLRLYEGAGSFLEKPAADLPANGTCEDTAGRTPSGEASTVIGPYKLIEPIGEGGMGSVWLAQQTEPVKRLVALKLIRAGMDSKQVIARFEAERQALALMDHPNIARVLDGGTTENGRPYFVMDLVRGVPITRYCDEHHLTPRDRLELFIPVCQAIQHAHQKGIIHRDVKPSNVLVAPYDGKPVPKVIDFGVAKAAGQSLTEKTLVTGFGNIVGTLEYMSPEQAELNNHDIDTRSDIYSLGVLLYELLTGSPPFPRTELEKGGVLEMLRVIREQEPTRPSTKLSTAEGLPTLAANRGMEPAKLTKVVRGELDWIVMKALEKDRSRRYESANGLALDVQRYLADEPVQACPPSLGYRLGKLLRRNKGPVLAASLVLLALLAGIVGTTWGMIRANDEAALKGIAEHQAREDQGRAERAEEQATKDRDQAKRDAAEAIAQKDRAQRQKYVMGMYPTSRLWRDGSHRQVRNLLEATRPEPDSPEDLRGWEWHHQDRLCRGALRTLKGHQAEGALETTLGIAFSPDGRWLASCGGAEHERGEICLWDVGTGREFRRFHGQGQKLELVVRVAFSPDGKILASSDWVHTVQLWDVASGRLLRTLEADEGTVEIQSLAFSPDGRLLASAVGEEEGSKDTVRLWEVASGRRLGKWKTGAVSLLAFHPEGQLLTVTATAVTLHEPATGKVLRSFPLATDGKPPLKRDEDELDAAALSPDGVRLAVAAEEGIWFWDLTTGLKGRLLKKHTRKDTNGLTFSPDGARLASAGKEGAVEVWDLPAGCHLPPVEPYSIGKNPRVEVVRASREIEPTRRTLRVHEEGLTCVAFSPDGMRLAVVGRDGPIRLLDAAATGQESRPLRSGGDSGGHLRDWGVEANGQESAGFKELGGRSGSRRMLFTPDGGKFLVLPAPSEARDEMPYLCDATSGHRLPGAPAGLSAGSGPVAYSADGRWLASGCKEGIRLWEAATCRPVRTIPTPQKWGRLSFVADGRLVSVTGEAVRKGKGQVWLATAQMWDAASGRELLTFKDPARGVWAVTVSPNGRQLAGAGGETNKLTVWDLDKWRPGEENVPDVTLQPHNRWLTGLVYSPDGKLLATTGQDQERSWSVKVWDTALWKVVHSIPLERPFESPTFSPDGRFLAACYDPRGETHVKVWDVTGGEVFSDRRRVAGEINSPIPAPRPRINLAFSPDGSALAASDIDGATRIWDLATRKERLALKVSSARPRDRGEAGIFVMLGAGVAFSPDGRRLATGNPMMRVWDAAGGAELHRPGGHVGEVASMALSPDGRRLATGGKDQTVHLWELGTWKPVVRGAMDPEPVTLQSHTGAVETLAFSPDGRLLASGDGAGEVWTWDLADGRAGGVTPPLHRRKGHPKRVVTLAFSPDGERLVSVGEDGTVKVWDVARGRELSSGKLVLSRVARAVFSPDVRLIACGGENAVRLWDLSRGEEVRVLTVEEKVRRGTIVGALAFSPDGKRLAALGQKMIKIWDMSTFQEVYTIPEVPSTADLAFSPDGGWLVAAGGQQDVERVSTPLGGSRWIWGGYAHDHKAVFFDGRPSTPQREVEREALEVLDHLFNLPLPRKDVLDQVRSDPGLGEPVRQEALSLIDHYREEEDPRRYAEAARALARFAHLGDRWQRQAKSQAEAAVARAPEDGYCLTALGMAQYRLGRDQEALETLVKADRINAQKFGSSLPADLALLALVHHRLGHGDAVSEFVCRLDQRIQEGRWKEDVEALALLSEVALRLDGTMPPWPAAEGAQTTSAEKPKP